MMFIFVLRIYSTSVNPLDIKEINRLSSIFFNKILSYKELETYEAKKVLDGESWQNCFLFENMVESLITGSKFPEGNQGHIFHDFLENLARQVYSPIYLLSLEGNELKADEEECDFYDELEKALVPNEQNLINGLPEIRMNDQEMDKIIQYYKNCLYNNNFEQGNYTNEELLIENRFPDFDDLDFPSYNEITLDYKDEVLIPNSQSNYSQASIIISISIGISLIGFLIFVICLMRQIKTHRRRNNNNDEP